MKKLLSVLLVLCMVCSLGAAALAGGRKGDLEVGILLAEGTTGYQIITEAGDKFMEENPGLEIEYTFANTKARSFMDQRWRSGDAPDTDYFVFNAQVPSTYEFTEYLLDLKPYLDADPEWRDSFYDSYDSITHLGDAVFGVISDCHILGLYYNKAYFDEWGIKVPETWDEFLTACETLKAHDVDPIAVTGTYTPYMGMWTDYLMMREIGYDNAKEAVLNGKMSENPGIVRAIEKAKTLVDNKYLLNGFEGTDFTAAQVQFFQGKCGMILMGTWLSSEMADSIPEDFQLGITTFPTVDDADEGVDQTEVLSHNNIISINKDSENLDAAIAWAKYFTREEVQSVRAQKTNLISAVKTVPVPTGTYGLAEAVANAGPREVRFFGLEFQADKQTALYNEVAKLFFGEYTVEQFLAAADGVMQALK